MSEQCSQASASTTEEKPAPISVEVVQKYNTEQLIQLLRKEENLQLDDGDYAILRNEKITGLVFFDITKQEYMQVGMKMGPATVLVNFAKEIKERATVTYSRDVSDVRELLSNLGTQESATVREQELIADNIFLKNEIDSLKARFNKSTHVFDVFVHPKQKAKKWTVNIEQATLEDLKKYIRKMFKPPALEDDGAELNLMNDGGRYSPRSDQDLRETLRIFVSKNNLKFNVIIETPKKPFNKWSFPDVCELYGLSDDPNPSIDVYPVFSCGYVVTNNEKYQEALRKLFDELETRVATTPIDLSYEATKSIYSYSFLASATFPFKSQIKIVPEKLVEGNYGHGNLDYGIESRTTGRTIGLVEVKRDDFRQGFAQATIQMESSLSHKRKADEIDDEYDIDKVWGIVTDAEKWYFMECTLNSERKPSFKLSKPLSVAYEDQDMKVKAERVFGHILWLLEEAQKPVKALEESREIKRVKSVDLAGKS